MHCSQPVWSASQHLWPHYQKIQSGCKIIQWLLSLPPSEDIVPKERVTGLNPHKNYMSLPMTRQIALNFSFYWYPCPLQPISNAVYWCCYRTTTQSKRIFLPVVFSKKQIWNCFNVAIYHHQRYSIGLKKGIVWLHQYRNYKLSNYKAVIKILWFGFFFISCLSFLDKIRKAANIITKCTIWQW